MKRLSIIQLASIIAISVLFILSSCQQSGRKRDIEKIQSLEKQLERDVQSGELSNQHMFETAQAMKDYLLAYPDDTMHRAEYYKKAAMLFGQAQDWNQSIALIDTFISRYPQHEYAPELLHFKAFYIDEEGLKDLQQARINYLKFLDLYPDHELVKSVLFSLENLGKPAEEVLDSLIKQNRDSL